MAVLGTLPVKDLKILCIVCTLHLGGRAVKNLRNALSHTYVVKGDLVSSNA